MATRLLLVLVAAAVTLLHPEVQEWFVLQVETVVNAPRVRQTTAGVAAVTRLLEREAAAGRRPPRDDAELHEWLRRNHTPPVGPADAWGTPLYLQRQLFRVQVGSAGPDRVRGTEDDLLGPPLRTTGW